MNQNSLFLLLQTQPFPRFQKSHNHSLCFGLSKIECEWLLMTEAKIAYKNSPQVKQSVQVKHSVDSCIAESAAVPNAIGSVSRRSSSSDMENSVMMFWFRDLISSFFLSFMRNIH